MAIKEIETFLKHYFKAETVYYRNYIDKTFLSVMLEPAGNVELFSEERDHLIHCYILNHDEKNEKYFKDIDGLHEFPFVLFDEENGILLSNSNRLYLECSLVKGLDTERLTVEDAISDYVTKAVHYVEMINKL